jgi:hypothetical protein
MTVPEAAPARRAGVGVAASLLLLGVFCFIFGAALAWGANPLLGFSIGGVGTVLLVVGSIMARNAMVGRFLEGEGE